MSRGLSRIWPDKRPLVGMVHLMALPGAPGWGASMDAVVDRAVCDARALDAAGFDGVMVENFGDVPFFAGSVPPETVAALTAAVIAVRREVACPVGVNVLRNDARSALGIAAAAGAAFIRVNVHTGSMWTDQGLIEGDAASTLRARAALGSEVAILADVHVKHATPPAGADLVASACDAWDRGLADAVVLSGAATGLATELSDVGRIRDRLPDATILVGSGATPATIAELLEAADGVIVGSAVMHGDRAGNGVDPQRAEALIHAAR